MEFIRMLLTTLLVGFACLPCCSSRRYYFINELKSWTEAQDYCRKHYYDLATFDNQEEHEQVVQTLVREGHTDDVWIGLYDDRYSWRWSSSDKIMTYTNWAQNQPDSYKSKEACAVLSYTGLWNDKNCEDPTFFLCYNATMNKTVLIQETKSWSNALNYCRLFHTDLATIENQDKNTKLKLLLNSNVGSAFMGLYRDTWKWSDQSSSAFTAWATQEPNNSGGDQYCAQLYLINAQWDDTSCSKKLKCLCGTAKKIQILKINMQSAMNLDVRDLNSTILQQLQQKLRKLGLLSNTKLTWRTQTDGQIFHSLNDPNTTNDKQCKTVT